MGGNVLSFLIYIVSLMYNEINVTNTYAWISDTAISRIVKINRGIEEVIILFVDNSAKFLNNSINKCPATILAVSRTDKVIGRMIFLTISMMNMKLINGNGVPIGIVWINICFVENVQANIIIINHIENARVNEILIWAVGVKMNGNKAIKFKMKMNKKIDLIKLIIPLGGLAISALISLSILLRDRYFFLWKNFIFKITVIGSKIVIHERLSIDDEGSKMENRFISM